MYTVATELERETEFVTHTRNRQPRVIGKVKGHRYKFTGEQILLL